MRPRFSLRLFLIAFTLIAIAMGGATQYAYRIRDRARRHKAAIEKLEAQDVVIFDEESATRSEPRAFISFARTWIDPDAFPAPQFVSLRPQSPEEFDKALEIAADIDALHTLAIGWNKVTPAQVDAIARRLPDLRALRIESFSKTADSAPSLAALKSLESVYVLSPLSDDAALSFTELPSLRSLDINPNKLSPAAAAALGRLPALRSVTLHGYDEFDASIKAILQNPELRELRMECYSLNDVTLAAVEDAKRLERLTIRMMGVSPPLKHVLRSAAKAPALTYLSCYAEGIDLIHLGELADRGKLQELDLSADVLEPKHLTLLKRAAGLKKLLFCGDLSDQVILDLLRSAPQCEIDMSTSPRASSDCDGKRFHLENGKLVCEKYNLIPCPN